MSRVLINEVGHRYGKLVVLDKPPERVNGRTLWSCVCDCGKRRKADGYFLRVGQSLSCGCYKAAKRIIDERGKRYGRLVVLNKPYYRLNRRTFWQCRCDCGTVKTVDAHALRNGTTLSCGCYRKECTSYRSRNRKITAATRRKQSDSHIIDERGNRYGKLTVVSRAPRKKGCRIRWRCLCKCGNYITAYGFMLRRGKVTSCGCTGLKRVYRRDGTHYYLKNNRKIT